jgi:hypothetical protein
MYDVLAATKRRGLNRSFDTLVCTDRFNGGVLCRRKRTEENGGGKPRQVCRLHPRGSGDTAVEPDDTFFVARGVTR